MSLSSGFYQPPDSYRFSTDALLLASFAWESIKPVITKGKNIFLADLGTGCGIIPLTLLQYAALEKKQHALFVCGIEKEKALFDAAVHNAQCLFLPEQTEENPQHIPNITNLQAAEKQSFFVCGDIGEKNTLLATRRLYAEKWYKTPLEKKNMPQAGHIPAEPYTQTKANKQQTDTLPLFDIVTANPPWFQEGTGRLPPSPARRTALFGNAETLPLFFTAAAGLLKEQGAFFSILHPSCLPEALHHAQNAKLQPVAIRFVHSCMEKPALFFLLEARKKSKAKLVVGKPVDLSQQSTGIRGKTA